MKHGKLSWTDSGMQAGSSLEHLPHCLSGKMQHQQMASNADTGRTDAVELWAVMSVTSEHAAEQRYKFSCNVHWSFCMWPCYTVTAEGTRGALRRHYRYAGQEQLDLAMRCT